MVTAKIQEFVTPENEEDNDAHGPEEQILEAVELAASGWPPAELLLGALRNRRLRVRSAISVTMTTENDDYIAEAKEVSEFGFGKNPSDALVDLQLAIAELYFSLERDFERLGPDLLSVWDTLQLKVEKVA